MYSTASLQGLCLFKVVEHLECYPPQLLACLPPTLRRLLLVHLPILDVCKLTNTCVFDGIDPETIWEKLYKKHVSRHLDTGGMFLKCDISVATIEKVHTTFRERYLSILANVILNRARPSGYFTNIDYVRYVSINPPPVSALAIMSSVDIVNTLIAGDKIAATVTMDENALRDAIHSAAKVVESLAQYSTVPVIVMTDYERYKKELDKIPQEYCVYKQTNEHHLYVPTRYSTHVTYHRISDHDALSLLMNDIGYYPMYLSISTLDYNYFGSRLLRTFLSCLESLKLSVEAGCYETFLTTVLSNKTPVLSSLELGNCVVKDEHLSFLAKLAQGSPTLPPFVSPLCTLTKLSIAFLSTNDLINLGTVISCQKTLASLSVAHMRHTEEDNKVFVDALISLFQSPSFESVSFKRNTISCALLQDLVVGFLSSPCTHPQRLTFECLDVKKSTTLSEISPCQFCVQDSSSEYKTLEFSADGVAGSPHDCEDFALWLCTLQPLKLNTLKVFCHVGSHPLKDCLPVLVENTSFHVRNLSIFQPEDFSAEAIQKLLKSTTLKSLEIGLYSGMINFQHITEYILQSLSSDSTLEKLKIVEVHSSGHTYEVLPFSKESISLFSDALFSLPFINQFTLEITLSSLNQIEDNIVEFIEILHESWKKNGGRKLKRFELHTSSKTIFPILGAVHIIDPEDYDENLEMALQMVHDIGLLLKKNAVC